MHSLRESLFEGFSPFLSFQCFCLRLTPFPSSNMFQLRHLQPHRGDPSATPAGWTTTAGAQDVQPEWQISENIMNYIELSLSHDITIFWLWYFVVSFDTQTSKAKEFVECYWKWESLWYMKGMQTPKEENVTENGQLWHSCGCGIWDRIPCVFLPLHRSQFKAVLAPWHADIQQFARRSEMRLPQTFKH